ncbi:Cof-type HAD-IIB family hydrolase [Alteribacter aurantiacus]|uniref:Cof-type HAD-IIB family hydrolase n=1 Tax=Alteribacter aurantiacus TaxID=254410 RepID=UPI00040B02F3|nr:Cof-type HAD-IIB family hydrolase [Alteribacter aurantiacus]
MSNKVVFLDIDGTILDEKKQLPQSTKTAIQKLQDNNINVAIATGRAPFMFKELREELKIDSFISFNGSYVVFKGETIHRSPLSTKRLLELERDAWNNSHPMVFLNHETGRANHQRHPLIEESMGSLKMAHPPHDEQFHKDREIYQALLFCEDGLEKHYHDHHLSFDYVRWHEKAIDVLPPGGSKAKGIEVVLERLGIPLENSYAFGDGLNDLEMLKYVGTGVAMGNAVPEAKEAANHETDHVENDGIHNGLVKLGLI